jgi:hypothetical protein
MQKEGIIKIGLEVSRFRKVGCWERMENEEGGNGIGKDEEGKKLY